VPYFAEKGTYRFIMQAYAPDAGKQELLTLLIEWDGADFAIRSANGEILEPRSDTEEIHAAV
jgi:hypothetical protein